MKELFHIIFGIIFRTLIYYSPLKESFSQFLLFPMSPYSFKRLKEEYIYNFYKYKSTINEMGNITLSKNSIPSFQSEQTFIVK
ncbi:MAG: hypothetical protein MJ252_16865 [archaeon]|nr:hypothetical protein [archaeon]